MTYGLLEDTHSADTRGSRRNRVAHLNVAAG